MMDILSETLQVYVLTYSTNPKPTYWELVDM